MAAISNLYVDQGADFSSIVTVISGDGTRLNLDGYTVKSQMRKSYRSSKFHNFTASVFDAPTGRIRLQLSAAQTEIMQAGRWLYDVEITDQTGKKRRVVEGIVVVSPEITQT